MKKNLPIYDMTISDNGTDGVWKISIVDEPAIMSNFMLFDKEGSVKLTCSDEERHVITGPVMIPNFPIYRKRDGEEFYIVFSKESIEKSMQLFFKRNLQASVSIGHEIDVNDVYVFESYLVDHSKGVAPNYMELPDGTWICSMKCENDELWETLRNTDLLNGFSVEVWSTPKLVLGNEMQKDKKPLIDSLLDGTF